MGSHPLGGKIRMSLHRLGLLPNNQCLLCHCGLSGLALGILGGLAGSGGSLPCSLAVLGPLRSRRT